MLIIFLWLEYEDTEIRFALTSDSIVIYNSAFIFI